MSKTKTTIKTRKIDGKTRYEKVLQGKKWWMLRWRDCYTCLKEPDGFEYYPITSEDIFDKDEKENKRWQMLLDDEKYVWVFFHWFVVKI